MRDREVFLNRFLEIAVITVLKMASLILMGYVIAFLSFFGGLSELGSYSAVTSVTAPLAMFFMFRYVEWIALSEDKALAFSVSVSIAVTGFVVFSPIVFYLLSGVVDSGLFLFLMLAFKPLELFSDFYVAMLVSRGERRAAFFSIVLKLSGVIFISTVALLFGFENFPLVVAVALFASFLFVFLFYDLPCVVRNKIFILYGKSSAIEYLGRNFMFGVQGLLISFNSVAPRYYLIAVGDMRLLGLFTLIYQIAASIVNVIQYPISIKISGIRNFLLSKLRLMDIITGVFFCVLLGLVSSVMLWGGYDYNHSSSLIGIASIIVAVLVMFIFLTYRGLLLSLVIATGQASRNYLVIVFSFFVAILVSSLIGSSSYQISPFAVSLVFVIVSSFVTGAILSFMVKVKALQ